MRKQIQSLGVKQGANCPHCAGGSGASALCVEPSFRGPPSASIALTGVSFGHSAPVARLNGVVKSDRGGVTHQSLKVAISFSWSSASTLLTPSNTSR